MIDRWLVGRDLYLRIIWLAVMLASDPVDLFLVPGKIILISLAFQFYFSNISIFWQDLPSTDLGIA